MGAPTRPYVSSSRTVNPIVRLGASSESVTWRNRMIHADFPQRVRVGGQSKLALGRALREHNVRLNQAADALFSDDRFTTLEYETTIDIECLTVGGLGFPDGATYEQLVARGRDRGLVECPLELGPHLRLQFLSQPEGSVGFPSTQHRAPPGSITVASSPLDEFDETPKGFYLRCIEGVLWLRGYWCSPDNLWRPEDVLVFAKTL